MRIARTTSARTYSAAVVRTDTEPSSGIGTISHYVRPKPDRYHRLDGAEMAGGRRWPRRRRLALRGVPVRRHRADREDRRVRCVRLLAPLAGRPVRHPRGPARGLPLLAGHRPAVLAVLEPGVAELPRPLDRGAPRDRDLARRLARQLRLATPRLATPRLAGGPRLPPGGGRAVPPQP